MKFCATLASIVAVAAYAEAIFTNFDPVYDNADQSMTAVECSTGSNGMIAKGFKTFGELPTFPNIGGAPAITMINDPDCGSCWNLTFTNSKGDKKSIVIIAIDASSPNFSIGETAMNTLTGNPTSFDLVPITAVRLVNSACGL